MLRARFLHTYRPEANKHYASRFAVLEKLREQAQNSPNAKRMRKRSESVVPFYAGTSSSPGGGKKKDMRKMTSRDRIISVVKVPECGIRIVFEEDD